jgi:ketosteroid isomerase-like protein
MSVVCGRTANFTGGMTGETSVQCAAYKSKGRRRLSIIVFNSRSLGEANTTILLAYEFARAGPRTRVWRYITSVIRIEIDQCSERVGLETLSRQTARNLERKAMKAAIVAVLVTLLAPPCVAQPAPSGIEKAKQQFQAALNAGDAATLARMSTESAILLPPNAEMIEGREAIEKYWRTVFAAGLKNVSLRAVRIDEYDSDAAREIGRIHVDAPARRDVLDGKYVTVWRKKGEDWLLDSSIWNFTQPIVR